MMNHVPGLSDLLETLDRDQLRGLLLHLVARHPDLADEIAGEVATAQARATPPAAGQTEGWERYMADVRATHGRKHKLMALLKGL